MQLVRSIYIIGAKTDPHEFFNYITTFFANKKTILKKFNTFLPTNISIEEITLESFQSTKAGAENYLIKVKVSKNIIQKIAKKIYSPFISILRKYQRNKIGTTKLIDEVGNIMKSHNELLEVFNTYDPEIFVIILIIYQKDITLPTQEIVKKEETHQDENEDKKLYSHEKSNKKDELNICSKDLIKQNLDGKLSLYPIETNRENIGSYYRNLNESSAHNIINKDKIWHSELNVEWVSKYSGSGVFSNNESCINKYKKEIDKCEDEEFIHDMKINYLDFTIKKFETILKEIPSNPDP